MGSTSARGLSTVQAIWTFALLLLIGFGLAFFDRYGLPVFEIGTFHDRMVTRLERIGRGHERTNRFIQQALTAIDEKGYTILQFDPRSDQFSYDIKKRFDFAHYGAFTVPADRTVIINLANLGQWSKLGVAGYNQRLDRALVHEMVHVICDEPPLARSRRFTPEAQIARCVDPDAMPPYWQAFLACLTEEALAHIVEEVVFRKGPRLHREPFDHPDSHWRQRLDFWVDRRKAGCFARFFDLPISSWARRFPEAEAAILRERYRQASESPLIRQGVEDGLIRLGLL